MTQGGAIQTRSGVLEMRGQKEEKENEPKAMPVGETGFAR